MDAAERLNAVGLAGVGVVAGVEDSSTVAAVGAACSGCGGDSGGKWLVVETAVASGWQWRQRWQVAGGGDSMAVVQWLVVEPARKQKLCEVDQLCDGIGSLL